MEKLKPSPFSMDATAETVPGGQQMIWVSILEGLFVIMLVIALVISAWIDIQKWRNKRK